MPDFTTETYCETLGNLDRARAIRAIHEAHLQLAALTRQCDCEHFDNAPAITALADCLREAGHTGYTDPRGA